MRRPNSRSGTKDRTELSKTSHLLGDVTEVVCTRYYSWKLTVGFAPQPTLPDTSSKSFLVLLARLQEQVGATTGAEGHGEAIGVLKAKLLPILEQRITEIRAASPGAELQEAAVSGLITAVTAQLNESWQKELIKPVLDELARFLGSVVEVGQVAAARTWVAQHLPKFVYFDRYDVIDSAIHIPTFVQQLNATPSAPRVRATSALFQHVGLDLKLLQQLDPTQPNKTAEQLQRLADERAISDVVGLEHDDGPIRGLVGAAPAQVEVSSRWSILPSLGLRRSGSK